MFTAAPGKLHSDDPVEVHMQQGPSLGGIDSGDENRNKAIANFVDFVMGDSKYTFSTGISSEDVTQSNFDDEKGNVTAGDGSTPLAGATNPIKNAELTTYDAGDPFQYAGTHVTMTDETIAKYTADGGDESGNFYGYAALASKEDAMKAYEKTPDGVYVDYGTEYYGL